MGDVANVELLAELAERLGLVVRRTTIDGPGGVCEVHGRRTVLLGEGADRREQITNLEQRFRDMEAMGLDQQVIIPAPPNLVIICADGTAGF